MKRHIACLALPLLTACLPPPQKIVWQKPYHTVQDFQIDKYKCLHDAASSAPTVAGLSGDYNSDQFGASGYVVSSDVNAPLRNELFNSCMQANGWHLLNLTQFTNEIKKADALCSGYDADDRDKAIEFHKCVVRVQRPIWINYRPDMVDLYDKYREKTAAIMLQFHDGTLDHGDYINALKAAEADFILSIKARIGEK